jgi:hypothetical protein
MTDGGGSIGTHSRIWAHVIERIGLAMMGLSCGLFVAAEVASSEVETFGNLGFVLAMTLYGGVGGYLGVDIPRRAARARSQAVPVSTSSATKTDSVEVLSAIGTFLAALMAIVCVYIIIFDALPGATGSLIIGSVWLVGVTMQIAAGLIARLRKTEPFA